MRTIPQRELRNDSAKILAEVEAGATIEITRHGRPAAVLVSPQRTILDRALRSGNVIPAGPRVRLSDLPRATGGDTIAEVLCASRRSVGDSNSSGAGICRAA